MNICNSITSFCNYFQILSAPTHAKEKDLQSIKAYPIGNNLPFKKKHAIIYLFLN